MNSCLEIASRPAAAVTPARRARAFCLSDLLRLLDAEDGVSAQTDAQPVLMRHLHAGGALHHEGDAAESVEFVRLGTLKVVTMSEDGNEQVLGFAERADLLGFDALYTGRHPTCAVALEDCWLFSLRVGDFFRWSRELPALDFALHRAASRQLARCHEVADVMAAVVAEVRLARFLVHQAVRSQALGQSPRRFVLRMTRRDLANHLGVAHETVSRSFTALAQWGCLRVDAREVEIVDFERLRACTRAPVQHAAAHRARRPATARLQRHAPAPALHA